MVFQPRPNIGNRLLFSGILFQGLGAAGGAIVAAGSFAGVAPLRRVFCMVGILHGVLSILRSAVTRTAAQKVQAAKRQYDKYFIFHLKQVNLLVKQERQP